MLTLSQTQLGINIMLGGLACQVASLLIFACACAEYAFRLYRDREDWNLDYKNLYTSRLFKAFLLGLGAATLTIFVRSCFRVAELSGGFRGPLANNETSFMVLEGAMIIVASLCLTLLHPGLAFQGIWAEVNFPMRIRKGVKGESSAGNGTTKETIETP